MQYIEIYVTESSLIRTKYATMQTWVETPCLVGQHRVKQNTSRSK